MDKKTRSTVRIVGIILAVLAIIFIGLNVVEKLIYSGFYVYTKREFKIAGIHSGYVPQGLDYDEEDDLYLSCGYMSNGKSSRIYVRKSDGSRHYVSLKNENGTDYLGHTGGIAHGDKYIYITSDNGLDVFSYEDVVSGIKLSVEKLGTIETDSDPAYCYAFNGKIYVGSFYRAGNYETPDDERLTTPSGDNNMSIIKVFDLDDKSNFGISPDPVYAYSARGLVQGMCFIDNPKDPLDKKIVLSTSYGVATSNLYVYDEMKAKAGTIILNGSEKPLYYLDSSNLVDTIKVPPMSEEIIYKDGRIWIMTEAASNKYLFGKVTRANYVYSYKYN